METGESASALDAAAGDALSAERHAAVDAVVRVLIDVSRRLQAARSTPFAGRELTRTQLNALFVLAHREQVTPTVLAGTLNVTMGAVTQLLSVLKSGGLVESHPHPHDARSVVLSLTPQAAVQVERFEKDFISRSLHRFDGLSLQQLSQLSTLLESIGE